MSKHYKKSLRALSPVAGFIAFASSGLLSTQVVAQDQQTSSLEEVVVTAQKISENIQDVPISITSFKGDDLLKLGITESDQLGLFTPGLEISTPNGEGSQLRIFLRGAGLSDFNTNNAGPIAIYADEVYLSSPALTTFDLFDIERVEVLKGPQGTLYGRNTTGGAIKFISNKPTEEFSGRLKVRAENFDTTSIEGAISGSLADNVRGRFAYSKNDSDGFGSNVFDGSDTNGVDTEFYRAFLDVDINENFNLRFNIHGGDISSPNSPGNVIGTQSETTTSLPVPFPTSQRAQCSAQEIRADQCVTPTGFRSPEGSTVGSFNGISDTQFDTDGGYFQMNWTTGNIEITSVTAYDEVDRVLFEDTDASPDQILETVFGVESETFTQELRATSKSDNYEWLIGAYYLTEELTQNQTIDINRAFRAFNPAGAGLPDPQAAGVANFFGAPAGSPILFGRSVNDQEVDTLALFGQISFNINDQLSLTVGGRYTDEERTFSALGQLEEEIPVFAGLSPDPTRLVLYDVPNLETSDSEFSWRLGLDYKPNDNVLLFANVSRGFKSGGFNGGFINETQAGAEIILQPIDPEFVTSYELGLKSDLLDGRVRFNSSLFFNDFEDLQVFAQINTGGTPLLVLDNASNAEAYGIEFELSAIPADSWFVSLSGTLQDSELQSIVPGGLSGDEISDTPNTSLTALIRYQHDLQNGGLLALQSTTAYRDETSSASEQFVGNNDYALTNFRATYESESGAWNVSAFINNAFDREYITNASSLNDFGIIQFAVNEPRTYGMEVSYNF